MVLNLGPVGCYPGYLVELPHINSDKDEHGCMISYNNAVYDYNKLLKETLTQTRETLPDASIIYVDTNSALMELFHHPTSYGTQEHFLCFSISLFNNAWFRVSIFCLFEYRAKV